MHRRLHIFFSHSSHDVHKHAFASDCHLKAIGYKLGKGNLRIGLQSTVITVTINAKRFG
jgi:hypothetical protein